MCRCVQRRGSFRKTSSELLFGPLVALLFASAAVRAQAPDGTPWSDMDYGPYKSGSYIIEPGAGPDPGNHANKGIAVRLDEGPGGVSEGREFLLFDTDTLRWAAGWTGEGFIDWNSITYNGRHGVDPAIVGHTVFSNPDAPGWSSVEAGFSDTRFLGRAKEGQTPRRYGPQSREIARWRGLYLHGDEVVLSYWTWGADVLELGGMEGTSGGELRAFSRTVNIGARTESLVVQVAYREGAEIWSDGAVAGLDQSGAGGVTTVAALVGDTGQAAQWVTERGQLRLRLDPGPALRFKILIAEVPSREESGSFEALVSASPPVRDLEPLTHGGPGRWGEPIVTESGTLGRTNGPFVVDVITTPLENPYRSWMRLGGFDFFPDGKRAAVATWMGDLWIVDGTGGSADSPLKGPFRWRRVATGMYESLGVKIRGGEIFVTNRDQITRLHDLDGDGEMDFYEAFNHDAQASAHYHEFARGLETDDQGNFYYTKAAGHDFDARVPQHGTLLRVSADGQTTEILASGFRAPNGLDLNPDGSVIVTDQEGHWTPENRLNWVEPGTFHGYMRGWHDEDQSPDDFVRPLTWIHHDVDRSPSAPVWVRSDRWGLERGSLVYLSYGNGKIFSVLFDETPSGARQAAVTGLPIASAPTGLLAGRFHPEDGQLYTSGLFGWSSDRTQSGGLYRVRYTGQDLAVPVGFDTARTGLVVTFRVPLDPESAGDPGNYSFQAWEYLRQASYGSEDYHVLREGVGRDTYDVVAATPSASGRSVFLEIEGLLPVEQYHLEMNLRTADGARIRNAYLHGTLHELGELSGAEALRSAP